MIFPISVFEDIHSLSTMLLLDLLFVAEPILAMFKHDFG